MSVFAHVVWFLLLVAWLGQCGPQITTRSPEGSLTRPIFEIQSVLLDADGDGFLETEESGVLVVTVTNRGGKASKVIARLQSIIPVKGLSYDKEKGFEKITGGESREARFAMFASEELKTSEAAFSVEIDDVSQLGHTSQPILIKCRELQGPEIVMSKVDVLHEMFGMPQSQILPGYNTFVDLEFVNAGQLTARDITVSVHPETTVVKMLSGVVFALGDIPPGIKRYVKFYFRLKEPIRRASTSFLIQSKERRAEYSRSFKRSFRIGKRR